MICKQVKEDKYKCVYCHFDGYLNNVGLLLIKYYNTPELVDKLLNLGDISSLSCNIDPNPNLEHNFYHPQPYVTVAYGRDRGDSDVEAKYYTLDELKHFDFDYVYIYTDDNKWNYIHSNRLKNLKDRLS
jgi:hypothetical protein